MTGDLAVWLRAQLDADEQTARKAASASTPWYTPQDRYLLRAFAAEHIALHDPAFTLADITAKRAILDLHPPAWVVGFAGKGPPFCDLCGRRYACGPVPASLTPEESETMDYPCTTLRLLAQPYAGRPGWHNEWSVT